MPARFDDIEIGQVAALGAIAIDADALAAFVAAFAVGSSRVDLQACKLEYSIVSPK